MKLSPLSLTILFISSSLVLADEQQKKSYNNALKLDTLVITANREAQPIAETNAAVTVFTREDIDRLQPSNVGQLINRIPGVQLTQNGGRGANTGVFIRGTKTAQTLILIDGQRIGSASSGSAALQYLSMDQIERVEVLRGSRSAIYGADAIGGVIQIFTRRGDGEGINPRLRLAVGNHGTWERSLGLSGGNDKTRFSLNAALDETRGIDRTRRSYSADHDHDAYRNKSFSFTISHQLTDDIELGFNALDQRGKTEYDSAFSANSKPYTDYVLSNLSTYINFQVNDFLSTRLELGHAEDKARSKDKLNKAADDIFNTYRDSVTWLNTLTLNEQNTLLIGVDYLNDKLRSSVDYDKSNRWNRAGFIQHSYQGDFVFAEMGLRHDKNQQYGSKNTWNASVGFNINPENKLIFSYAEGFRTPVFNDLYYPAAWGTTPNPNLKPETSKSYEIQWKSQLAEQTYFEASLYHTSMRDMIAYISNPITWTGSTYNVDKARINGFEAALHQDLWGWQGVLGMSIIDPRDVKTGHTLQNRAKRTFNVDIDRPFGDFSVGASWLAVSSSYGNAANTINIPGYGLLGIRGSWQVTPEIKFDAKIDNLLDKSYYRNTYSYRPAPTIPSVTYGYREEGITVLFGVTWTPKFF